MSPRGLLIAPIALVFQNGTIRTALLPWIAREQADQPVLNFEPLVATAGRSDPLAVYWTEIADALGDLLVTGLQRADERTV